MYSSTGNLKSRFGPVFLTATADDDGDGQPDTAVLEWAINDADHRIDAVLSHRYSTPFATPPWLVAELSSVLAAQNLARRRPDTAADLYHTDFDEAEQMLDQLATGAVLLPEATIAAREITNVAAQRQRIFDPEVTDAF